MFDAGVGSTVVAPYGTAERELPMPVVEDGMLGLARLYHAVLRFDASYTAWDGSGTSLKGGSIPTPNLDAGNLASDPADGAFEVQPRPGTMPGLYLYYDNETGDYYHYGGPLDSGASPQTTAIYKLAAGGGGGMFSPAFLGPLATTIYRNNLSGAELWHFGSASPPYIEVKHVDGTVAHFDSFDPYRSGYSASGVLWRVTSVRDPYDNTATYSYSSTHRLTEIAFPSGLKQLFDYSPGWAHGGSSDCLEIRYTQGTTSLPARTWGLVFSGTLGTSGGRHFGKRLYRAYSAIRRVLHDPPSGAPYTWSSDPYVDGQIVHELSYDTTNRILLETQSVHTGTAFAATLSGASGLPPAEILETRYVTSGGDAGRVLAQEVPLTGEIFACSYPSATRSTDLLSQSAGNLRAIAVQAPDGTVRQFEYDYEHGYLYRIVTTPASNFAGRPRANHASGENSGIGSVAVNDIEPEQITVDNVFDGSCVCQKPIEVRRTASRGSASDTRVTNFEYYTGTKLLKKRSEPNPQTGSSVPAQVHWQYTYVQAMASGQAWGAWLPDTEITPDGTYTYSYSAWQNRQDAASHGQIAGVAERALASVRIQDSLTGSPSASTTDVVEKVVRNLSSNPWSLGYFGNIQGQPRLVVDGDGVVSDYEYSAEGRLTVATTRSGQTRTEYGHDVYGQVETMTENAAPSSPHAVTTTFSQMSGVGVALESTTGPSSAPLVKSRHYFDRFGHLGVERRWNRNSAGNKPTNHAGSTSNARDWVEDQYHYLHRRLIATYRDRLPLDLPAGTGQFLKSELFYNSLARLDHVVNPNGSRTFYEFDGYGTLYRTYTKDPALASTVAGSKQFLNLFLEVTGSYEFDGTSHLWTLVERNGAGAVTRVTEPQTTAPSGYTTPAGGGVFSTGGARHDFSLDELGRVTKAETFETVGSTALLLASREMRYDQLGRQIWQHDEARLRDINGTSTSSTGDSYTAWKYKAGAATQLDSVQRTGIAATTYEYWASGLLKKVRDGFSTGNTVEYGYHGGTPFLSQVTRTDLDSAGGTRVTTTAYDADPLGRTTAIKDGTPQLVHAYGFHTLGGVDRYTDPMGRVQEFLPDALGRIVEHVRRGAGSDYILNTTVFEDAGAADGRTKMTRADHLGNTTITHYDFAGRPFIVQNPGGGTAPTDSAKHQVMCLYAEYDAASRLQYVYDGERGVTRFYRDGKGRVIQRELASAVFTNSPATDSKITIWNTKDVYRRDALGRIAQTDYWGGTHLTGHGLLWAVGIAAQDSIGRTHKERYHFAPAPVNALEVVSGFAGGNPYRSALDYEDGLDTLGGGYAGYSQPLDLDF
ncbi:MAG: RHS repeat protein, partial [Planctomycetes bacterium]|nr:RHS repeat protein [Planctomycetota bacterium]